MLNVGSNDAVHAKAVGWADYTFMFCGGATMQYITQGGRHTCRRRHQPARTKTASVVSCTPMFAPMACS